MDFMASGSDLLFVRLSQMKTKIGQKKVASLSARYFALPKMGGGARQSEQAGIRHKGFNCFSDAYHLLTKM